jgi:hypothetical protein
VGHQHANPRKVPSSTGRGSLCRAKAAIPDEYAPPPCRGVWGRLTQS